MTLYTDCDCAYSTLDEHAPDSAAPFCNRCGGSGLVRVPDDILDYLTEDADNTQRAHAREYAFEHLHIGRAYMADTEWPELVATIRAKLYRH